MPNRLSRLGRWRRAGGAVVCLVTLVAGCSSTDDHAATTTTTTPASTTAPGKGQPLAVRWLHGFDEPGTPAKYDRVGIIQVGSARAKNVLVLEPGTSAGGAYFVPLARWIVKRSPDWQVWSVERRENLLEDQSELDRYKQRAIDSTQLFDYYLGYLKKPEVSPHFTTVDPASVSFAKAWGMQVAVEDLRVVIDRASKLGGKVVLGGHSLGGSVVTAYATWDFDGTAGARGLSGLIYIDGGSNPAGESAADATAKLQELDQPSSSPWLSFGGIPAPYAGLFNATGSASALLDPDAPSLGASSGLLPSNIVPPGPVTNVGQYGYALNVGTSPPSLAAAQAHLGTGLSPGAVPGWAGAGALTPIDRYATMFSGGDLRGVDGTEWYFPQRLTDDTAAVGNGLANAAQPVLGLRSTMGSRLPKRLHIYAVATSLGGARVLAAAEALADQSGIPTSNLTPLDRSSTYAHNDPNGAYPENDFVDGLVPFLRQLDSGS
jgi:pimeloyl-ACP methyl ester carboxylesterase